MIQYLVITEGDRSGSRTLGRFSGVILRKMGTQNSPFAATRTIITTVEAKCNVQCAMRPEA